MIKKYLIASLIIFNFGFSILSQATIPTTWDFSGTIPSGWTSTGTLYSTIGNISVPSGKYSATGQYLQIDFVQQAGIFDYYIKGNSSMSSFQGNFKVQISDDGNNWTTKRDFLDSQIDLSSFVLYHDTCTPTTRYIRFYFSNKVSGSNIALDDITLHSALPQSNAEIDLDFQGNNVYNGATIYTTENLNATKILNILAHNLGTDSILNISNVSVTNSTNYAVVSYPTTINPNSIDTIKLSFTPNVVGSILTDVTVLNNDSDESSLTFHIVGYGGGQGNEPNIATYTKSNIKSYKYTINIVPNTPTTQTGYLVLFNKNHIPNTHPIDGIVYTKGEMIGDSKIAFSGSGLTYNSKETFANEKHYVSLYTYDGNGTFRNYNQTPFVDSVGTLATMANPNEYNGIDPNNPNFVTKLHDLLQNKTMEFYGNYDELYINEFIKRDTTNQKEVVTCVYSGYNYIYTPPFNFSVISREHTYPHSWMPTDATSLPEYNDFHNLYPANQEDANAIRSNYPLGEVVNITDQFLQGKFGTDALGHKVYEPRDEQKGDAARAIFYMATCYHGVNGNDWSLPEIIDQNFVQYGQKEAILKAWHYDDMPNGVDIARNDFIEYVQDNRNPFVDHPEWVCNINFENMTYKLCSDSTINIQKLNEIDVNIYPNPNNGIININCNEKFDNLNIEITDVSGKILYSNNYYISDNIQVDISNMSKGLYICKIYNGNKISIKKIIRN